MTRFLVCGSRDWTDTEAIFRELQAIPSAAVLITGDCPTGADRLAEGMWMRMGGGGLRAFPADWTTHGRAAGPIRNQRMLDEGKPELVLAFHKGNSRGTADMIRRAQKAGVPVKVITEKERR